MDTICIMCPMGCPLSVTMEGGAVKVSGNTCKRGEVYGIQEMTAPKRVVTSLVRSRDGVISVKTDGAVDKAKIFAVLEKLKSVRLDGVVRIGDVILENVDGDGVNVVATCNSKD